jgi:formylglycine-generating enzyme
MRRGEQPNEYVWEKDGAVMVYVPGGTFVMGREWINKAEGPPHNVRLDAFYIDKYEVTRAAFRRFVASKGYRTTAERLGSGLVMRPEGVEQSANRSWSDPGFPQDETHPVVLVSWNDAKEYASWSGKSLPTEAQWEKAASWDDSAPEGKKKRLYPWGDSEPAGRWTGHELTLKRGNFADYGYGIKMPDGAPLKELLTNKDFGANYNDGYVYTAPVGQFRQGKSPYGAFDMSGNVWEWCEDGFAEDFYSRSPAPVSNPLNPDGQKGRVFRGTGYDTPSVGLYPITFRGVAQADGRSSSTGFRCVVNAP